MSTTAVRESLPQGSALPPSSSGPLKRAWRGMGRSLRVFWTTRIVEGLFLRRPIEKFYLMMAGHIYFQTVSAAVQFDLFGLLKKHRRLTCPEIARHLGIEEKPARILLLGCTSLGLLRKSGEKYRNSRLAEQLLVRGVPGSIVPILDWQYYINYRAMYHFPEALRANTNVGLKEFDGDEPTLYERLSHDPKLEKVFQDAMQAISVQANAMFSQHVDLSGIRHLVDVGGGNGTNVTALVSRNPGLRATVFDFPSVCEIAGKAMQATPFRHQLGTHAGNCFVDPFPRDADCFLFCHFLTIWSEDENRLLLKKAFEALPSGGRAIVFNMMQRDSGTGPLSASMGSPYFLTLATGKGMLYTWQEYQDWMREAGFATVTTQVLPRDHGVVIGIKS